MSLTILAFICAMLAAGFFGNTLLSLALGAIAVTLCFMQKGKEKEHERMRSASLIVAIAAMIASTAFGVLSIYNTWQNIQAEKAAYQQQLDYYNQMYGGGTDEDGGYVVTPEDAEVSEDAGDVKTDAAEEDAAEEPAEDAAGTAAE